jgi:prolipoprotein diacylglyceryltransferase
MFPQTTFDAGPDLVTIMYGIYLAVSIALTVWVARTLFRNGRAFLVDAFHGREELADSVNQLLVVGFYLINVGYVCLALQFGDHPTSIREMIETLSTKLGLVLVVLGVMHFTNLKVFSSLRRRAREADALGHVAPPPPLA